MPNARSVVVIHRPIADVFAFLADAENDPLWRSGVKQINRQGEAGVGARYSQRISGPGGRAIPADIEVTVYEPPTRLAFRGIAGPVRPRGCYTLLAVEDGTQVTFTLEAELSGIKGLLMSKAVQQAMVAEVGALDRARDILDARA